MTAFQAGLVAEVHAHQSSRFASGRRPDVPTTPPPPFLPTSPYPFYPPAGVRLGFWALHRLVKQLPPPQSYAEWQYQQVVWVS